MGSYPNPTRTGALGASAADEALFDLRCFKNFKPSNTRNLRAGLARVRAGTGRLTIACVGDSTTAGTGANTGTSGQVGAYPYAYPALLKSILNSRLAAAVDASVWGETNAGAIAYGLYDTRLVAGAGWLPNTVSLGGKLWRNSSDATSFAFTPTEQVDTAVVWYTKGVGNATFTIDIDGGAALATVDSNAAGAVASQTVTFAKGAHTINIKRTSAGAEPAFIMGIYAYDSTAPGISVWNWGYHGSKSTTWNTGTSPWSPKNAIASVAPNVLIYGLGINDQGTTAIATFKSDVQAVITSAVAAGDCIIAIPNPVDPTAHAQAGQDAIRYALLDLAETNDLPVIDRSLDMESYTRANALGWMYDNKHPSKLGYGAVASLVARAICHAAG